MSKFVHFSEISKPELLDVVDEAWAQDRLPDDDVPLPEGMIPPTEEHDELRQQAEEENKKGEKWNETGLNRVH